MANHIQVAGTTIRIGDTLAVNYRLIEKEKVAGKAKREVKEEVRERIQAFEGVVIAIRGMGMNASFTVRRIGAGKIGIERIFPVHSPWIKSVTVKKSAKVRRAKLYYLRDKEGKEIQLAKEPEKTHKVEKKTAKASSGKPAKATQKKEEVKTTKSTKAAPDETKK